RSGPLSGEVRAVRWNVGSRRKHASSRRKFRPGNGHEGNAFPGRLRFVPQGIVKPRRLLLGAPFAVAQEDQIFWGRGMTAIESRPSDCKDDARDQGIVALFRDEFDSDTLNLQRVVRHDSSLNDGEPALATGDGLWREPALATGPALHIGAKVHH